MRQVEQCRGFTLWPGKRFHVELWICRGGIDAHTHPRQRVEVIPLWGRGIFWRQDLEGNRQPILIDAWSWFTSLTIPAGWLHGFSIESRSMAFINVTFDGRSAADNFVNAPVR